MTEQKESKILKDGKTFPAFNPSKGWHVFPLRSLTRSPYFGSSIDFWSETGGRSVRVCERTRKKWWFDVRPGESFSRGWTLISVRAICEEQRKGFEFFRGCCAPTLSFILPIFPFHSYGASMNRKPVEWVLVVAVFRCEQNEIVSSVHPRAILTKRNAESLSWWKEERLAFASPGLFIWPVETFLSSPRPDV